MDKTNKEKFIELINQNMKEWIKREKEKDEIKNPGSNLDPLRMFRLTSILFPRGSITRKKADNG